MSAVASNFKCILRVCFALKALNWCFLVLFDNFDVLMSKQIWKKYFNIFSNEKYFWTPYTIITNTLNFTKGHSLIYINLASLSNWFF